MTTVAEVLEQMRATRSRLQEWLAGVTDEEMGASGQVGERPVYVRGMFYRFVAHEVEHTVHLVKTLRGLGWAQSEAQQILGRLQAARGELEGLLVGLEDEELDRVPAEGEWSLRQVLGHVVETEESYLQRLEETLRQVRG